MLNMKVIQELEREFGKLANVPDDHPKLKLLNAKKNPKHKKETTKMANDNNSTKLNDTLFDQLNRLNNDDLSKEEIKEEINRSKAITQIASQIINNGRLSLDAEKFKDNRINDNSKLPTMLE